MTENWKQVPGFEGHYEVSDHGQVASVPRPVVSKWGTTYTVPRRTLVAVPSRGGHLRLQLCKDAVPTNHSVHVLVLAAFVGPRPQGMFGCHNDGNPANNHLQNLRWDTPSSNSLDTVKHCAAKGCRWSYSPIGAGEWQVDAAHRAHVADRLAQAVAADKAEAVRAGRAEALREVADAFDNGWYQHEDFRLAGVDEVATRGWSEKSVMDAWDAGSVWADFLRARAEAEQGGGE